MSKKRAAAENAAGTAAQLVKKVRDEVRRTINNSDPNQVHDLRVGIRRARQSLAVLHDALPSKTVRKARKKLGNLLSDAGPVRDVDVVLELMKSLRVRPSASLSRMLDKERTRLERKLVKSLEKFKDRDPATDWVAHMDDDKHPTRAAGLDQLPSLAEAYFQEGDRISDLSKHVKELHRFRLKTKKFRYTLELYGNFLGAGLKPRLDALREIQDHLGSISDCVRTVEVLDDLHGSGEAGIDRVKKAIRPQIVKHANAFRRRWKEVFDEAERTEWKKLLSKKRSTTVPRRSAGKAVRPSRQAKTA